MIENLQKALSEFISDVLLLEPLAKTLLFFLEDEIVYLDKIKLSAGENYIDLLLLAFEWKLFVPFASTKTCAWEDRLLLGINSDRYEMPKAVLYVLKESTAKALWDVEEGLKKLFRDVEAPISPDGMVILAKEIFSRASHMCITGKDVVIACNRLQHTKLADPTIAIFKSLGIISPKLSSVGAMSSRLGPLYDINPSLWVKLGKNPKP